MPSSPWRGTGWEPDLLPPDQWGEDPGGRNNHPATAPSGAEGRSSDTALRLHCTGKGVVTLSLTHKVSRGERLGRKCDAHMTCCHDLDVLVKLKFYFYILIPAPPLPPPTGAATGPLCFGPGVRCGGVCREQRRTAPPEEEEEDRGLHRHH